MKKQKETLEKVVLFVIICAAIAAIIFPFIIGYWVYDPDIFPWIPGKSDVWMGFWASYSGTVVTLIVAVCTLYNGKSISDLQKNYYQLNAGVNLRLAKVSILPIIESDNLNRYKIILYFHNKAKSLIREINLCSSEPELDKPDNSGSSDNPTLLIKVGENESSFDITDQYFGLQDGNAILQFEINLKGSKVKKDFIKSYFYFSQFPNKRNDINLDANIRVDICKQDYKKSKPEDWVNHLHIELFPEPEFDRTNISFDVSDSEVFMDPFKIKIKRYKWME